MSAPAHRRRWLGPLLLVAFAAAGCGAARGADPATPGDPGALDPDPDEPGAARPLVGGCGPAPSGLRAKYILPFAAGEAFELSQGNCGGASHSGRFRYAFDFRMPSGTPIIAARDGVVSNVRADQADGTGRVGDENFVFIEHADGEVSRYIHLQRAGAFVRRGDRVARGDTIGLSGNSGLSAFPHLHFDVTDGCDGNGCVTVPVAFVNARPAIPTDTEAYEAGTWSDRR